MRRKIMKKWEFNACLTSSFSRNIGEYRSEYAFKYVVISYLWNQNICTQRNNDEVNECEGDREKKKEHWTHTRTQNDHRDADDVVIWNSDVKCYKVEFAIWMWMDVWWCVDADSSFLFTLLLLSKFFFWFSSGICYSLFAIPKLLSGVWIILP